MQKNYKIVHEKSKSRWFCQIATPTNKVIRKYGKTKKEAESRMNKFLNDPKNINLFISQRDDLYIEDLLLGYIAQKEGRNGNFEESSRQRDERTARNQIIPYLGHYKINSLYEELIKEDWLEPLYKYFSASTVKKAINLANEMARYAIQKNLISKNPFEFIPIPTINKSNTEETRPLKPHEIELFYNQSQKTYKNGKKFINMAMLSVYASTLAYALANYVPCNGKISISQITRFLYQKLLPQSRTRMTIE